MVNFGIDGVSSSIPKWTQKKGTNTSLFMVVPFTMACMFPTFDLLTMAQIMNHSTHFIQAYNSVRYKLGIQCCWHLLDLSHFRRSLALWVILVINERTSWTIGGYPHFIRNSHSAEECQHSLAIGVVWRCHQLICHGDHVCQPWINKPVGLRLLNWGGPFKYWMKWLLEEYSLISLNHGLFIRGWHYSLSTAAQSRTPNVRGVQSNHELLWPSNFPRLCCPRFMKFARHTLQHGNNWKQIT